MKTIKFFAAAVAMIMVSATSFAANSATAANSTATTQTQISHYEIVGEWEDEQSGTTLIVNRDGTYTMLLGNYMYTGTWYAGYSQYIFNYNGYELCANMYSNNLDAFGYIFSKKN